MMNKKEIAPGIMIYSDVMDNYKEFIPTVENFMNLNHPDMFWSQSHVYKDGQMVIDDNRSSKTYLVEYNEEKNNELFKNNLLKSYVRNKITEFANPIERDYQDYYNVSVPEHRGYSVLKYSLGAEFTDHIDDNMFEPRRISTVWYINDNYEGGEICFPRFNIEYKPKANELLIFPSTYVYNHFVKPVKNGVRYCVVSWLN